MHGIDLGVSGLWFLICLLYKFQAINTNDLTILLEICPGWHAIVYSDKHRFTEEGWSYNINNHRT